MKFKQKKNKQTNAMQCEDSEKKSIEEIRSEYTLQMRPETKTNRKKNPQPNKPTQQTRRVN